MASGRNIFTSMIEPEDVSAGRGARHFFTVRFNLSRQLLNTSSPDFPLNSERPANSPGKRSLLRLLVDSAPAELQLAFRRVFTSLSARIAESDFPAKSTVRAYANTKIDTGMNATAAQDISPTDGCRGKRMMELFGGFECHAD